jgi:carboxyl-terminal processing protease
MLSSAILSGQAPVTGKQEPYMLLKTRAILVVVVGTVLGLSLSFSGGLMAERQPSGSEELAMEQARLFAEVMQRVKRDYVEPLDDSVLLENAIRGMVSDLDPHSQYLDADEYRDIRISTTGSYTGIGIEVSEKDGVITVISPMVGSPAARSGIRSGDQIVAVDGEAVETGNLQDTISRMRGRAGTRIEITVLRDEEAILHEMRREVIRVASVHHELLGPAYGYVRVNQFSETTARELSRAIDSMQDDNDGMLEGLVLDLRNNPGGVLDAAVDVSDLFLDSGVIVTAEGRTVDSRFRRSAHRGDILDGAELMVLVNQGSASASEIVAGALQDHGRGVVIGTRTFGKGLVQTVMPLSKGRAIKLTTSRYYTPSGDSIHETGITPDVFVEDAPGFPDLSLAGIVDRKQDAQLLEAVERLQRQQVMHSKAL